ncbi:predicted protein [Nematostella vectensis]|uniref:Cyclin B n=2 Tax=Nematostella vectensis TaxID=45351 RepID=A7SPG5_NEMVE|nr:predicted protein [Nematostella vectensis]|eukprot:XP_001626487.1 predicted protein [Nematostella vectensis]
MDMADFSEALNECFPTDVEDIDSGDYDKPQLCAEYAKEIMRFLRAMEEHYSVSPTYMNNQQEVNEKMRAILLDWLVQVHLKFRLLQETLYITMSIIDRFLAVHQVSKRELQLVGVGAMLLASKYEEMFAPEIGDFVYITDHAYTKKQIRQMESLIFRKLDFSLGKPLCLHFLRRNSKAGAVGAEEHTMAKYLMELTLIDYQSIKFLPSEIAAASLSLAMRVMGKGSEWTPTLEHYSGYSEKKLSTCMQRLAQLVLGARDSKQKAVYNKYASSKFMKISTMSCLSTSTITTLAAQDQS